MKEKYTYSFRQKLIKAWSNPRVQKPATAFIAIMLVATGYFFVNFSRAAVTVTSVRSGNWSSAATWSSGSVPTAGDTIVIAGGHNVTYDTSNIKIAGMTVSQGGSFAFDPNKSVTLESSKNIIVNGTLSLKPASPSANHTLRFTDIDEEKVEGSGMNPKENDIGLWIMGAGKLDAIGTKKTAWTNAAGSINSGTKSITLKEAPVGWKAGDKLAIAPTVRPTEGISFAGKRDNSWHTEGFDEVTIASVSGSTVTLVDAVAKDHSKVNDTWTAEVMNLDRNVMIEGTPGKRAHIFMRSEVPQTIKDIHIRYLGPRKDDPGAPTFNADGDERILGRWPLHFHHMEEKSKGSLVEGVVATDLGTHAFVNHASDGVTFKNTVAYNVTEQPYWWDNKEFGSECGTSADGCEAIKNSGELNASNDTVYDSVLAARVYAGDTDGGIYLSKGDRNVLKNSVAVGVDGRGIIHQPAACCGGDWSKNDNLAHNNGGAGFESYYNPADAQPLLSPTAYHNTVGISNGAYRNSFLAKDFILYGNRDAGVVLRALSNERGILYQNGTIDGGGISPYGVTDVNHVLPAAKSTVFENVTIKGNTEAAIGIIRREKNDDKPDLLDFVNSTIEGKVLFIADDIEPGNEVRFQNSTCNGAPCGTIAVRPKGQLGTLVQEWNAVKQTIAQFSDIPPISSPVNQPPTANITTPANNASFTAPATVNIAATASDSDGTISKVEFFRGSSKLGEDTTSPYNFSWTNAAAGNYSLTAKATDSQGASTTSSSVNIVVNSAPPADTTPPAAPTGLAASAVSATQINLSWNENANIDGVVKYLIQRNGVTLTDLSATSYVDNSVLPSTTYRYRILAVDAAGNTSATSIERTVTTPDVADTQAPTRPTNLIATAPSPTQVNLTWNASSDNIAVAGYHVFRDGTQVATVTTTNFGEANLAPDTTYSYRVRAFDQAGNSSQNSVAVDVMTPQAPGSLYLSPTTSTITQNNTFAVNIWADSGNQSVNAVQANVFYPQDKLEYVSTSNQGSPFTIDAQTTAIRGRVSIARGTGGGTSVSGRQLVAIVTFKAISGNGSASLVFTDGSSILSSTTNQSILSTTAGASYNFTSRQGDINTDGKVNVFDLSLLLGRWNTEDSTADLNADGKVNVFDLSILLRGWEG